MSLVVWKYPLDPADEHALVVPRPGRIVLIGAEFGRQFPTVWVEVDQDPDAAKRILELSVRGTGHPIPEARVHRGSAICGPFVWHVYEKPAVEA